ncbi:hypothetical protein [Archangium sp.]|uniref:hypothetical protein n=1 Tax=Archangium sp. TaxID=1872627 RepID=UPI002D6A3E73|nr:hypothetical protein [Archangium sp.]HYO51757.1 hypothetical protein [Archangium sp.]
MNIIDADITKNAAGAELHVTAYSPTLGWREVALSKVEYIVPPQDGLQEFVLGGTPPSGSALTSIMTYSLTAPMPAADWVRGARIKNPAGKTLLVLGTLVKGKDPIGQDWVAIENAGIKGDKLILEVKYGGGCQRHSFQLAWDGSVIKTEPPQLQLSLTHNGNGDPCKALLAEQLQFDLSLLIDAPADYVLRVNSGITEVIAHTPTN